MNKWIGVSLLACAASAWATQTITFQVNMSVQEALGNFVPGSDNVVVRGSASLHDEVDAALKAMQ